jgi:hypothetical protein
MAGTPCNLLVADVESIHGFLCAQALVTNVSAAQQSQCESICRRILNLQSMDTAGATALTQAVQLGPWTLEQKQVIASHIQARLSSGEPTTSGRSRKKLQTISSFENYLTEKDVQELKDPDISHLFAFSQL